MRIHANGRIGCNTFKNVTKSQTCPLAHHTIGMHTLCLTHVYRWHLSEKQGRDDGEGVGAKKKDQKQNNVIVQATLLHITMCIKMWVKEQRHIHITQFTAVNVS